MFVGITVLDGIFSLNSVGGHYRIVLVLQLC